METSIYIAFFVLFVICGFLLYQHVQLERRINEVDEQNKANKKALSDAGNAITETLRVAFDNLKRHNAEINKISNKHSEYQSRLHRLEHASQQMMAKNSKNISTEQIEELKNEKRNSKTS